MHSRTRDRHFVALILLVHFLVTVGYSLVVPLGEAPDELSHYDYFRYVAQERALPSGTGVDEAIQPPLYYALGALVTFPIEMDFAFARSNPDFSLAAPDGPQNLLIHTGLESWPYRGSALAFHLVRLLSAALSTLTVWAIYRLGRELFPEQEALALGATGLVAFVPEFCFLGGAVNNDNLAAAVGALLLWRLVRLLRRVEDERGAGYGEFTTLGLLLGAGLLTKTSFLAALPLAVLVIGWFAWKRWRAFGTAAVKRPLMGGILASAGAVLMAGGWYWRNLRLYGDPLAWKLILEGVDLRTARLTAADYAWLFKGLFQSFWGRFGGAAHIRLPAPVYGAAGALSLASALGLGRFLVQMRVRMLRGWQRWGLELLAAWLAVIFVALLRYTAVALGTDQARLLYPALASLVILFVLGLAQWLPPRGGPVWAFGLTAAGFIFSLLVLLLFLRPIYAPPAPVEAAALADIDRTSAVVFDERLALVGHEPGEPTIAPGGVLRFTLYWRAERRLDDDLRTEVWVLAPDGGLVASWKRSPTGGRFSTDRWPVGQVYADEYALPLPDWLAPGEYTLAVGVRVFPSETWLSLGGELGSLQHPVATVRVRD